MGNNDSSVETFLQWIKASDNIVFFGGAGVSTESESSGNINFYKLSIIND